MLSHGFVTPAMPTGAPLTLTPSGDCDMDLAAVQTALEEAETALGNCATSVEADAEMVCCCGLRVYTFLSILAGSGLGVVCTE